MAIRANTQQELDRFKNIITDAETAQRERDAAKAEVDELKAQLKEVKAENKELEVFKPLLDPIPLPMYKVQLRDGALMRQLCGKVTQMYGKRFKLDADNDQDKRYSRQLIANVVMACIRYCVLNNGRWNDMYAHYLSGTEKRI